MKTIKERLAQYRRNYSILARSHYVAANRLGNMDRRLGAFTVILSTLLCATIFTSLAGVLSTWVSVILGIGSLGVALLSFSQLHFRFNERSTLHRDAAARFADLRRRIELKQHKYERDDVSLHTEAITEIEHMLKEFAILGALCPKLDDQDHKKAEIEYKSNHGIGAEAQLHSQVHSTPLKKG